MFRPGFPYSEYLTNIRLESKRPGSSISFLTSLFEKPTLIAGQATVKLFVSLEKAKDTDLFLALRYLNKDDQEVTFDGILDSPNLPVTFGYQRLSKRKTDKTLSHDDFIYLDGTVEELVEEGQIVETTIMLGPVSVIVEKGGRLCLEVRLILSADKLTYS